ncbi:MAG: hypothetical protein R6U36_02100 [Candidatus Fermentibacteraceae bacterium]
MLVMLPQDWPDDLDSSVEAESVRVLRRKPGRDGCDSVRSALGSGERLFLLCADGAAADSGWMVAGDHIGLFGPSPLAGPNRDDLGPRFPSLKGIYSCPEGSWRRGLVLRVPHWQLATPAELAATGADAAVSAAVDEAVVAGHGGGRVMLLVRCSAWGSACGEPAPLAEAASRFCETEGENHESGAGAPETRGR